MLKVQFYRARCSSKVGLNKPSEKRFLVGDVTTCRVTGRYRTAEEAARVAATCPEDLLAFHEAHKPNLGMVEDDDTTDECSECGAMPHEPCQECPGDR
jgi:hypothetical protein